MEKRGISQIKGKTEIRLGEEVFYEVTKIYRMEDHDKVKNASWKLYVREYGKWRELKQSSSTPPKRGDRVSYVIRNQRLVEKELLVEAYIYQPETKSPPGLVVKVLSGEEKKIYSVQLFKADDSPITKDTILKYNQTIKVKVHTQNMSEELLKLTLYEDDAKGGGHNIRNEQNKVAEITKRTNKKGFLWHEFKLNANFSKIANAIMDGSADKHHEYYILVESAENGTKASRNINVENPDYNKIYYGKNIKEVIVKGKLKRQIGIDPIPKTGKSMSKVAQQEKENNIKNDENSAVVVLTGEIMRKGKASKHRGEYYMYKVKIYNNISYDNYLKNKEKLIPSCTHELSRDSWSPSKLRSTERYGSKNETPPGVYWMTYYPKGIGSKKYNIKVSDTKDGDYINGIHGKREGIRIHHFSPHFSEGCITTGNNDKSSVMEFINKVPALKKNSIRLIVEEREAEYTGNLYKGTK